MELVIATAAVFAAALVAPPLFRLTRQAHLLLALVPLAITLYLLTQVGAVRDGEIKTVSYEWIPALGIDFALRLDGLSLLFSLLITGVGTLIVVYAGSYLGHHPRVMRFFVLLFLFMGSMLGLVLADNLIVLFVFWELTSISSFGLIAFESERDSARSSALQALLVTAGGGLALLAGLVLLSIATGTQSITELLTADAPLDGHHLYLPVLILFLVGAFTKSAQFPFHFWLPNAMEAPTPVSAYLHSATMVKAGVFLLARFQPVLGGGDTWFYVVSIFGGATMVIGAVLALRDSDLKRMLAYATVSTLGSLVFLLGLGTVDAFKAAMVLIFGHAMYKAALFLIAGIIDHETGTRLIERLGGLKRAMPITAGATALAAASMAGIPPLFGFLSKETVYEAATHGPEFAVLATAAAVFANVIMVAVAALLFFKPFLGEEVHTPQHPHEPPWALLAGPLVLVALSIVIGVAPNIAGPNLLGPAATAVAAEPIEGRLALWHGFNLVLLLSVVTVATGLLVMTRYASIRPAIMQGTNAVSPVAPETWYDRFLTGLYGGAGAMTRVLQHGYLRLYLATVLLAALGLGALTMATRGSLGTPDAISNVRVHDLAVAAVIIAGAGVAVFTFSRLTAAVALGMMGFGVALIYLLHGAPDVAMAQILVETLTVLLFVFAFYRLPRFASFTKVGGRLRDAALALVAGVAVTALLLTAMSVERDTSLSESLAEASKPLAHGSNVVNVILVDFRALDTLGEIVVLGVAALGVITLLRMTIGSEDDS